MRRIDTGQTPCPGEEGGGGQGSFVSFSKEKETKEYAASFSLASSVLPIPSFPPTPPSPSCSPRARIHPYFSYDEKESEDRTTPLSLAPASLSSPWFPPFPSFPSYFP